MPTLNELVRAARARPVRLDLGEDGCHVIPPATLDQVAACVLLDPDEPAKETAKARTERLRRQARILLGPDHEHLTGRLGEAQITLVVGALYIAANGLDAEQFARWQEGERELAVSATRLELLASLEELTVYLAVELRKLPAEAGAIPLADALAAHKRIQERYQAEVDFQIALRGGRPG